MYVFFVVLFEFLTLEMIVYVLQQPFVGVPSKCKVKISNAESES